MIKNKKVDLILCADLHLRDDQPVCRTDDYMKAQDSKVNFLLGLQRKYGCPILCAGDLFEKAKSSKSLEIKLMNLFSDEGEFVIVPGNHDLPNHNIKNINDSSIGILSAEGSISILLNELNTLCRHNILMDYQGRSIGMIHSLIHKDNPIKSDGKIISKKAIKILKDNPECDLILSGDNHQTFIEKYKGRLLVNPGSMMRMKADQEDHKPCVFLYSAENNEVEQVFFPIEENVISREHINIRKKDNERMKSLVERMNDDYKLLLNFEKNLEAYFKINRTRKSVHNIVWECVE